MSAAALIVGEGTPEPTWRAWTGLAGLPAADLPTTGRVVVVAAHPDDETLGVGGLLRELARRGCEVAVVVATDGEASHPGSTAITPAQLARRRRAETHAALAALGLPGAAVTRLGLPDGELAALVPAIAGALAEPLGGAVTCLATWRGDGHPDHEAVGHAAARACASAGVELIEYPVWLWHWARPADSRVPWRRARSVSLDAAALQAKRAAVAAFRSQVEALGPAPADRAVLSPQMLARYDRPFEVLLV